jgi:hypothetical protein
MIFRHVLLPVVVPLDMADNPEIPHGVTRRRYLGMILPVFDVDRVPVFDDVGGVPDGGKPEALGGEETVVVYLRLRVVMGGIA